MSRVPREYSLTGYYHIMMRGNERKNIFLSDEDRHKFINTLVKKKEQIGFKLYAFCLMDNHIHLLINDEKQEISLIMKGIATSYAMFFNRKYQRVGHVFQDRFKSESIENERYLLAAIRYIHCNPVKASLVEKPEDYIWSSYRTYIDANLEEFTWLDKDNILEFFSGSIDEFEKFSNEKADGEDLLDNDLEGIVGKVQQGRQYLKEYLKQQWPDVSIETIKDEPGIYREVILELRRHTSLSIRSIAELIGVGRNKVERVKIED